MKRVILQAPDYVLTAINGRGMGVYYIEDVGNGLLQVMQLCSALDINPLVTQPSAYQTKQQPLIGVSVTPPYTDYGRDSRWVISEPFTEKGGSIIFSDVSPPRSKDFLLEIELRGRCATDERISALKELGFTEVEEEKGD